MRPGRHHLRSETTAGTVEACDWVFVEHGRIREVNAYYDSVTNRAALEQ